MLLLIQVCQGVIGSAVALDRAVGVGIECRFVHHDADQRWEQVPQVRQDPKAIYIQITPVEKRFAIV